MRKFVILISLVVCCVAAPTSQQASNDNKEPSILLQRPSPINPDVPSDPKPDEKIVKIDNPKEIAKYKRETADDLYDHISRFAPTVQPARQAEKDHSQQSSEEHIAESDSTKTPSDLPNSRQRRQVDPHLIGAASVGVTPLIYHDEDNESKDAVTSHDINTSEEPDESTVEPDTDKATQVKRDVPVPLVPKYQHPEVSPKDGEKQEKDVDSNHTKQRGLHKRDDHHFDKSKSSESSESEEDSNEKTPAHNYQPVQNAAHPQLAQHQQSQTAQQHSYSGVSNYKPEVHQSPAVEHGNPVEVPIDIPVGEHLAVHPKLAQQHQAQVSAQTAHTEQVPAEHAPQNNTSNLEQLAGIQQTKIIDFEAPANDNIAFKHPVPVAELFSRPKQ